MPATYENLATTTLGTAAANITFSSISGSYTDLRVVIVGTSSASNSQLALEFNSDTASNYSASFLRGTGSIASGDVHQNFNKLYFMSTGFFSTSIPSFCTADILSYANSSHKTVLLTASLDQNATNGGVNRGVGLWRNTAAITTVKLLSDSSFAAGTTATLYGILRA